MRCKSNWASSKVENGHEEDAVDQSYVSRWLKRFKDGISQENDGNVTTTC